MHSIKKTFILFHGFHNIYLSTCQLAGWIFMTALLCIELQNDCFQIFVKRTSLQNIPTGHIPVAVKSFYQKLGQLASIAQTKYFWKLFYGWFAKLSSSLKFHRYWAKLALLSISTPTHPQESTKSKPRSGLK